MVVGDGREVGAGIEQRRPPLLGEFALVVVTVADEIALLSRGERLDLRF